MTKKKSWMDSQTFEEWVHKLDQTFPVEGKKIALLIDNCPAHPSVPDLTNVQLVFLPPNTTSQYYLTTDGSRCNHKPKSVLLGESHTSAMQSIR